MAQLEGLNNKNNKEQEFIVETPLEIEEHEISTGAIIKYERGKFLGKGGFAKCYEMKRVDNGRIFAAKVFDKKGLSNGRSKKKLINEIKIHKKLNNPNIVGFEKFFEDKDNVYILLELCSNQTLNELVKRRKRLGELEVQCYSLQIIRALKYIHNHRIIHRDLKLGNLFLTSKLELKLGDFGLAAKLEYDGQRRKTVCGTPNYVAPEILEKKNGHSYEVDIWSLGVIIYTMLFGVPPFDANDEKIIVKKIKMNSYKFPDNIKVDPSAKKLISSLLNLDPSKRPSLDAIVEHDFFKIYHSIPLVLPLSTLSCPLSQKYISEFLKNDNITTVKNNSNQNNNNIIQNNNQNINYNDYENFGKIRDDETTRKFDFNSENDNININFDQGEDDNLKSKQTLNDNLNISPEKKFFSFRISKYFDYSSKFGFVYFINNTHIGVCFNDFSNIIKSVPRRDSDSKTEYLYYEKDGQPYNPFNDVELEKYLSSQNTSKEMIKKFQIFKKAVERHKRDFNGMKNMNDYIPLDYNNMDGNKAFFIKKFLISTNGVLFRLSNKLIQIFFNDNTEMCFSTETTKFLYINDERKEINRDIQEAINGKDQDLINKIKISKNLLIYFVKTHKSKKVPK